MRLNRAIDLWLEDLGIQQKSEDTQEDYRRDILNFADRVDPHGDRDVADITELDCRAYLGRYAKKSPSTMASKISIIRGFFGFCVDQRGIEIDVNPMAGIKRPSRLPYEDLDVPEAKYDDVIKIIGAVESWQELLCVGACAYMARRRTALANARRRDWDREKAVIRFRDKGGKFIFQPVPLEFQEVLVAADEARVWDGPNDWLIPPRRKATTGTDKRESKVIYETLVKVAIRAGVRHKDDKSGIHTHSLRAAFGVQFMKQARKQGKGNALESLKALYGHARMETTMVYLRRMDRAEVMEDVRDLSWGGPFVFSPRSEKTPVLQAKAHTGFEPVPGESPETAIDPDQLSPVRAKLDELRALQKEQPRERNRRA